MTQDKMYTPKDNPFGTELFGDSMYTPDSERLPRDSRMYNFGGDVPLPTDPEENVKKDEKESIIERLLGDDKHGYMGDFVALLNTAPFKDEFEYVDYLSFHLEFDGPGNTIHPYKSQEFKSMIVKKGFRDLASDRNAIAQAILFIPFGQLGGIEVYPDYKLINKLLVHNRSGMFADNVITGVFRTPVAITRDVTNRYFDRANCSVVNLHWFAIRMEAPAHYFAHMR